MFANLQKIILLMKKALLFALFVSLATAVCAQYGGGCGEGGEHSDQRNASQQPAAARQQETPIKVDYLIYPNPASDFFALDDESVELGLVRAIQVYNVVGQRVQSFRVEKQQRYYIADLPGGLYLVQLLDANNKVITTRRLQKNSGAIRP